jgi:hypothetical protein
MAARLSALCAGRTLPPGFFYFKDSWYSFLLEADAVYPGESKPAFISFHFIRSNILPPPAGSKTKPCSACCLLCAGFLLVLLSDPDDGGDMFLQKMADFHQITKILYPRTVNPSSKKFSSTRQWATSRKFINYYLPADLTTQLQS